MLVIENRFSSLGRIWWKRTAKKIPNTLFPLPGTKLGTTPNLLGSLEELRTSMVFTKEPLFVLTA
jgi:hypothetical protein